MAKKANNKSNISKTNQRKRQIPLPKSKERVVVIKISEQPLDHYRSPHLLDLSKVRFIEKVRPAASDVAAIDYRSLPAGELLAKFYIFEFLSFEKSEIIGWLKKFWQTLIRPIKQTFTRVDLSPKLPLAKGGHELGRGGFAWQETALINFFAFIFSGFKKAVLFLLHFLTFLIESAKDLFKRKDEVIEFAGEKKERILSINKAAAASQRVNFFNSKIDSIKLDFNQEMSALFASKLPKLRLPRLNIPKPEVATVHLKYVFLPRLIHFRPLITFIIIALMVALPLKSAIYWQEVQKAKGRVLGEAEEALNNLKSAQAELMGFNLQSAQGYFSSAHQDFTAAQEELKTIQSFVTAAAEILPASGFKSGRNLLELGRRLSGAGEYLLEGINQVTIQSDLSLVEKVKLLKAQSQLAQNELQLAQSNLKKVNFKVIPTANRGQFVQLKEKLPLFIAGLKSASETADFLVEFLGDGGLKRYLVVFQNDNELRPTGGFMGSFALVDVKNGKIKNINLPTGGTYDVRAGFYQLLQAPEPFQVMNTRWEFQDANWWPDFPTSAKKIAWFYSKSGGPSVDGVIAINSDWLSRLLAVTGGIKLPAYNKIITAANFESEIQKSVELEYDKSGKPKKILTDLAPKLIEKLFNISPENFLDLATALGDGLKQKDILVYFFNEDQEKFAAQNGWDGRLKDTPKDYLSVIFTNIGGGKTDNVIKQKIYHQATISEDGSIIDQILISRRHFGPTDSHFTKVPNRSYVRVYVPLGSELIQAAGFIEPKATDFKKPEEYLLEAEELEIENNAAIDPVSGTKIYNENNKTVFANWLVLGPGESRDIVLVYKLPFKLDWQKAASEKKGVWGKVSAAFIPKISYDSYSLFIQKQPGENDDEVNSKLVYPSGFSLLIAYPDNPKIENNTLVFDGKLEMDLFYFAGLKN